MPSRIPFPPEIASVYLDFDWDRKAVWALDVEGEVIDRALLDWHLDLPFWSSRRSSMAFDVTPRSVLNDPGICPRHAERIRVADLSFPLDVMEHRGRLCIMDGLHRLAKAAGEGRERVSVRQLDRDFLDNCSARCRSGGAHRDLSPSRRTE